MNIDFPVLVTIAMVLSYLIGSFPSAFLMGKLSKNIDIRTVGSHNMGAMNTFYSVGFWRGMTVLILDIGKGALAPSVTALLGLDLPFQMASGVVCLLGHNFPVWLKFKGGKGGATCIGILVRLIWWGAPVYLATFLLLFWITKVPTISYGIAFFIFPILAWFTQNSMPLVIYSIAILIIPAVMYIPRLKEMRQKGGSWSRVFKRKKVSDRL
jgi:acyl phosphate:glycerol-3-phosphate acyltransferase